MLFTNLKITLLKLSQSFEGASILATISLFIKPLKDMVYNELSFFSVLTLAIIIDLLVGSMKYWKLNQFSFRKLLTGLLIKVIVAYGGILLFLTFATLDPGIAAQWFALVAKFTVLLYPSGSAFVNMYILTDGKFPPIGFMKKLDTFEEMMDKIDNSKDEGKSKLRSKGIRSKRNL